MTRGVTSGRAAGARPGVGHAGFVVWLTGVPAAGKSTIGGLVADSLRRHGYAVEVLDGDDVRRNLSPDLGFGKDARETHNRRIIYVAKLLARNGVAVIVPVIAPYRHVREQARAEIDRFVEVWVKCPLEECIRRDPKGLYRRALSGEITDLTGLQDVYEQPDRPELIVETARESPVESAARVALCLRSLAYLDGAEA